MKKTLAVALLSTLALAGTAQGGDDIFAEPWRCSALEEQVDFSELELVGLCATKRVGLTVFVMAFPTINMMRFHRLYDGGSQDYVEVISTINGDVLSAAGVLENGRRTRWERPQGEDPDPDNTKRWELEYKSMLWVYGDPLEGSRSGMLR